VTQCLPCSTLYPNPVGVGPTTSIQGLLIEVCHLRPNSYPTPTQYLPCSASYPNPVGVSAQGLQQRCEQLSRDKEEAISAYEALRRESGREAERLRRRAEVLTRELDEQAEQARALEAQVRYIYIYIYIYVCVCVCV